MLRKTQNIAKLARGTTPAVVREQLDFVEKLVQRVDDKTQLPSYRKPILKLAREQRKLQLERVRGLLSILACRDIRLLRAQQQQLRAMPLAKLPALDVAMQAKSASDFALMARLRNGWK